MQMKPVMASASKAPMGKRSGAADKVSERTRAGILACVERGIRSGELPATLYAPAVATVFDSFLQGISILARDNTQHEVIDAAITQLLLTWDIAASTVPPRSLK